MHLLEARAQAANTLHGCSGRRNRCLCSNGLWPLSTFRLPAHLPRNRPCSWHRYCPCQTYPLCTAARLLTGRVGCVFAVAFTLALAFGVALAFGMAFGVDLAFARATAGLTRATATLT